VLVGVLVSVGLGYETVEGVRAFDQAQQKADALDRAAEDTIVQLTDLGAVMRAYVAAGQDIAPWSRRAVMLLDSLRQNLMTLDAAVATSGGTLATALDNVDQLRAADKRAREYVANDQHLLAGDLIFSETRTLLDGARQHVATARDLLHQVNDRTTARFRQSQALIAVAAVVVWVGIALVLVPTAPGKREEWRQQLAKAIQQPIETPVNPVTTNPIADAVGEASVETPRARLKPETLKIAAEVCADLSAMADVAALPDALARASEVLGASGLIVWVASNDRALLSPVSAHGFDPNLLMRIGSVRRDGQNLTSRAFREGGAHVSVATDTLPAALAVAMNGPSGVMGVLSAELRPGRGADDSCVALASIFAAQLATLALPAPATTPLEWPRQARG
jgi:hypothetical protein